MLDNVRYLICWLPIILTALHFVLDWMGLSHHYTGKPRGHFETFQDGTLHWWAPALHFPFLTCAGKVLGGPPSAGECTWCTGLAAQGNWGRCCMVPLV